MYKVSATVRASCTDEGGIILDLRHGKMFDLNPVAARVMDYLSQGRAEEEIIDRLTSDFAPVSRQQVTVDLRDFLQVLFRNQLVEVAPLPNSSRG